MSLLKRERDDLPAGLFESESPKTRVVARVRNRREECLGVVLRERGAERLLVPVSLLRKTAAAELGREAFAPVPPCTTASPSAGALTA